MKIENNQVTLRGKIAGTFKFGHEFLGEKFYLVNVETLRTSGNADTVPVTVSEKLIDTTKDMNGENICVEGQFRSYNKDGKLILTVFADEIHLEESLDDDNNSIVLKGYVCKEPIYRETPLGREITDILLAVNRKYGRSDYIPCICWGRNALFTSGIEIGTKLRVEGRIQSRQYTKKLSDGVEEIRTAYEVSISRLEVLNED